MEDDQIIDLYWSRREEAICETDKKYGRLLAHISYNILSSYEDSEECVNDTYGKAWETIPPQKPNSLSAYLGRIIRNLSINRWYENHTKKRGGAELLLSELSECIPSVHSLEEEIEESMLTEIIAEWLNTLQKEDRTLFIRRYWYGDSLKDLSGIYTENKLAGRLFRLRKKLRKKLEQEGIQI